MCTEQLIMFAPTISTFMVIDYNYCFNWNKNFVERKRSLPYNKDYLNMKLLKNLIYFPVLNKILNNIKQKFSPSITKILITVLRNLI